MKCLFTYLAWKSFLCEGPAGLNRLNSRQRQVLASQSHHRLSSTYSGVGSRLGLRAFTTYFEALCAKQSINKKALNFLGFRKCCSSSLTRQLHWALPFHLHLLRTSEMGKQSGVAISILCIWQPFHLPKKSPLSWVHISWVLGNHHNINICQSCG